MLGRKALSRAPKIKNEVPQILPAPKTLKSNLISFKNHAFQSLLQATSWISGVISQIALADV